MKTKKGRDFLVHEYKGITGQITIDDEAVHITRSARAATVDEICHFNDILLVTYQEPNKTTAIVEIKTKENSGFPYTISFINKTKGKGLELYELLIEKAPHATESATSEISANNVPADLEAEETLFKFCPVCGAKAEGMKFCPECGHNLTQRQAIVQQPIVQQPVQTAAVDDNVARCPRCGSTSLSANKKGFGVGKALVGTMLTGGIGLLAGNIGAKKVRVTCLKCGKQWMA